MEMQTIENKILGKRLSYLLAQFEKGEITERCFSYLLSQHVIFFWEAHWANPKVRKAL